MGERVCRSTVRLPIPKVAVTFCTRNIAMLTDAMTRTGPGCFDYVNIDQHVLSDLGTM